MSLPHDGVRTRLAPSPIHGVGVFAIEPIAAGTSVFANDHRPIHWVRAEETAASRPTPPQRALYDAFAIRRGDELGCPANFNLLTVGGYCNEPAPGEEPNLRPSPAYDLIAARDIAAGEELTVRYADYQ